MPPTSWGNTAPPPTAWYTKLIEIAWRAGDTTQQDIAIRLGVSPAAVTYWKTGSMPSAQTVVAAAEAYGTDARDLLCLTFLES
jgi:transcriptional regulator with XRE-family HTH domain